MNVSRGTSLSRRPLAVAALALALATSACSSGLTVEDRIAAIAAAREQVGAPASELGTAVAALRVRLDGFAAHPSAAEHAALVEANDDLADALAGLDAVVEDLADDEVADVAAAGEAMAAARIAGAAVAEAVDEVIEVGAVLVDTEPLLAEVVAAWDQSGSRSEQIAHFDELAERATVLADDITRLVADVEPTACPGPLDERIHMAVVGAEVSAELGDLVASYQGTTFDDRRAELHEDPFGLGSSEIARALDGDCPMISAAEDSTGGVDAALEDLEQALNPADLAG